MFAACLVLSLQKEMAAHLDLARIEAEAVDEAVRNEAEADAEAAIELQEETSDTMKQRMDKLKTLRRRLVRSMLSSAHH